MARYRGPIFKKSRRYGFSILESGKEFAKGKQRSVPPRKQGARRKKLSDYGLHLYEKQKVKYMYGVSEKQLKRIASKATKDKGVTGTVMLQLLEQRLDNVIFRIGFATTRKQSRQLVSHNHFTLNGKKANIPSMLVSLNDKIELKAKSHDNAQIKAALESKPSAEWISRNKFTATFNRFPERTELNKEINEALVVEHFSK